MNQNTQAVLAKIDRYGKNTRENPTGWLRLNLEDETTLKYVEKGFYVDERGVIYDTLFWPGDSVVNTKENIMMPTDVTYVVSRIGYMGKYSPTTRYDITGYMQKGASYRTNVIKSKVYVGGYSSGYSATNFKLAGTKKNMLSLEQKKPTLVIEVVEKLVDNTPVLEETGDFEKFESVAAARAFVSTKIREAVRQRNAYPSYRIYTEESVAVAEEPPIVFK